MSILRPAERRVFDILCAHPHGLTVQEIIPLLYPDPDKEPDFAPTVVRVTVHSMNRKFKQFRSPFRVRPAGLKRYALFLRRVRV